MNRYPSQSSPCPVLYHTLNHRTQQSIALCGSGVRFFLVEPKSCFHAGDFVTHGGAIASICRRPASLDLGLAFRWPISRARRQMRGDHIKCLGLRTDRTSCINATDSICRRARMESQSGVKRGQWARVENAPKKAQLSKGRREARRSRPQGPAQIESVALCMWQRHLRNVSTLSNRTRVEDVRRTDCKSLILRTGRP